MHDRTTGKTAPAKPWSAADVRRLAGNYVAPAGLLERTKAMPFLGKVTCSHDTMVAGSWHEIVLDYEVGSSGIADGAWIKATFKFYSDWALFQTSDPKAANYVSAEYQAAPLAPGQEPATIQSLKCRFDQKGHERPFQKAIIVDVVDGYINPGDHIIIRLGDMRFGGPGTRVQTFVEKDFRFRCYIDPVGTSRAAAIPGDTIIQVVPGAPAQLLIAGTRLARPGAAVNLRLRAEDEWGNTCFDAGGQVLVTATRGGETVYERRVPLAATGWAIATLDGLPADAQGELVITARHLEAPRVTPATFYLTLDKTAPAERLFYGDLHVHSDDTIGTNDTVYNVSYGRDVTGLDFLSWTANDFNVTAERWTKSVGICREVTKDGAFICYPSIEWCGNSAAGGDHHVIYLQDGDPEFPLDRHGNVARSFEWNEDMKGKELVPGMWPLDEVYATYAHDAEHNLMMPHVGGRRCSLAWHHPKLERLVEISSSWGHFPWLFEEVVRRGYKLGAASNGDEHRGRCGGGVPGAAVFGTKGGVTGLISPRLDRAGVAKALRARHTWATTGERTVALLRCGPHIQGDEFDHRGPAELAYRFLGDAGWEEITAFDHSGCILKRNLHRELGYSPTRIRVRWGGARIRDRYRWAEWKGTVTVTNGLIQSFVGRGFEHKEESCWRNGTTTLGFRSDTYGDADTIEMEVTDLARCRIHIAGTIDSYVKVGDPLAGNPFEHCPSFEWEVRGSELLEWGEVRRELGGADLFLAVERLTDKPLPRDLTGILAVDPQNGPHGHRAVYVGGRQVDDAKAWSSPLFISFV